MSNKLFFFIFVIAVVFTLSVNFLTLNYEFRTQTDFKKSNVCCKTIHVAFFDFTTSDQLYKILKCLIFYRNSPLHFHFLVNDTSIKIVKTLFDTWRVPQVKSNVYSNNEIVLSDTQKLKILNKYELFNYSDKLIVMDSSFFLIDDVQQVWNLFEYFHDRHIIGMANGSNSVLLVHLSKLKNHFISKKSIETLLPYTYYFTPQNFKCSQTVEEEEINLVKAVTWSMGEGVPPRLLSFCLVAGNLTDNISTSSSSNVSVFPCSKYPESYTKTYKRRTLLFLRHFQYSPLDQDVTMVTQLSYDKLPVFEIMCQRWFGPVSATLYLQEDELEKVAKFIENSHILKERYNISYHAVIKRGQFQPLNYLRNVALRNVVTSHVFLLDTDFLPNLNLHETLVKYLNNMKTYKKALVVPAFSARSSKVKIPLTIEESKSAWDDKRISQFRKVLFPPGHRSTNYTRLRNATKPYTIKWQPKYEPYVVVQSNVTEYDERFFGYGHNKISHILTLNAQGYEFVVLPDTFAIHKVHKTSKDYKVFIKNKNYTLCLNRLIDQQIAELNATYGTDYKAKKLYF